MTTAFVLSGGGNLGSVQAGMLRALYRADIKPDLIVGTSVGAFNGGWLAGRGHDANIEDLAETWRGLRRTDVFPTQVVGGLRGFVGRKDHLVPDSGLRKLLRHALTFDRLENSIIPFHVVATDLLSGTDVLLSRGDAVDAICASSAIPGIFPAVTIDDRTLVDGGVVNNCPISHAIRLGALACTCCRAVMRARSTSRRERTRHGAAGDQPARAAASADRRRALRRVVRAAHRPGAVPRPHTTDRLLQGGADHRRFRRVRPRAGSAIPASRRPIRLGRTPTTRASLISI